MREEEYRNNAAQRAAYVMRSYGIPGSEVGQVFQLVSLALTGKCIPLYDDTYTLQEKLEDQAITELDRITREAFGW